MFLGNPVPQSGSPPATGAPENRLNGLLNLKARETRAEAAAAEGAVFAPTGANRFDELMDKNKAQNEAAEKFLKQTDFGGGITEKDLIQGSQAAAIVAASTVPFVGELMDIQVLLDPTATPTEKALALASLAASIGPGVVATNYGALRKAAKMGDAKADEITKQLAKKLEDRFRAYQQSDLNLQPGSIPFPNAVKQAPDGLSKNPKLAAPDLGSAPTKLVGSSVALSDATRQLAEANLKKNGKAVLGPFTPAEVNYIDKANVKDASYFDIGAAWDKLTDAERWAANSHFLDKIAGTGDQVFLSIAKGDIDPKSYLAKEVDYLTKVHGYRWVNQWSLVPGR
jgi:hypothetical protein